MSAHKDFIAELAEKHRLPEEQVNEIIKSFYKGFKYYLTHPVETKAGILINNFITIHVSPTKLRRSIERLAITENKTEEQIGFEKFYHELKATMEKHKLKPNPNTFNFTPTHEGQNSNEFLDQRSSETVSNG